MSDIVKFDSLNFTDIRADIEQFMSITGEIDPADFNESSTVRRFSEALAALYNQLRIKIDNVRKESIMDSAIRPESIRYLAMSQLAYNPKRMISPQHAPGEFIYFRTPSNVSINPYSIIGNLTVGDKTYPISLMNSYKMGKWVSKETGETEDCYIGKCCIGTWKFREFDIGSIAGAKTPFFTFRVEEDRDTIDNSPGSVKVTIHVNKNTVSDNNNNNNNNNPVEAEVVENLYDLMSYDEQRKKNLVLVKNSYFGGLDINFGDGVIFGNLLFTNAPSLVVVDYLQTPGFIPNLDFSSGNISWDNNFILEVDPTEDTDESYKRDPGHPEYAGWPKCSLIMANGITAESVEQIKTLSPYVSMANQRIMTNDDFITRAQRIPNIKSIWSRTIHIPNPQHIIDGQMSNYVPTATFETCALTVRNVFPFVGEKERYKRDGDVVIAFEKFYKLISVIKWERALEGGKIDWAAVKEKRDLSHIVDEDGVPLWVEVSMDQIDEFQHMTQVEWDLNFHTQYNFDRLLGFMRVRVLPPVKFEVKAVKSGDADIPGWKGEFNAVIQLRQYVRGDRTPTEVNAIVRDIIMSYCWKLGAFVDIGKIVADIHQIEEVTRVYFNAPDRNYQLKFNEYVHPNLDGIVYQVDNYPTRQIGRKGLNDIQRK